MREPPEHDVFDFPCDFPVKAMGRADAAFEFLVLEITRRHFPDLGEAAVSTRGSRGGNYLSVTVTVRAHNREQLDALYRELNGHDQVLMTL